MLMKMRTLLPFIALLVFAGCGETEESEKIHINEEDLITVPVFVESADFEFVPPSPLEVAGFFKNAGLKYDLAQLNPPSNQSKYLTKYKKSVNFGVYSADLATCVLHDKITDAQLYLEAIEELASDIGMNSIFTGDLIGKFKRNLDNNDSIQEILREVQYKTLEYIEDNNKDDLESIYYAGAWMEGMYLGALTLNDQDQKKIVQKLAGQIDLGNQIARGLELIEDQDPEIRELRFNVLQIVNEYNTCESVINLSGEDLDFGRIHLTQPELESICGLIIELRTEMIQ
ncbi:MAG: hypothetical protein ACI9J3_003729 [Parvicellaceae bacterium]|jgi:hypothetical protein